MKRDMDLIRTLLLCLERDSTLEAEGRSKEEILYHVYLLDDAGFVNANITRDSKNQVAFVQVWEITWAGHEFLDMVRDEGTMRNALLEMAKAAGTFTVGLLKEYIEAQARRKLGIP